MASLISERINRRIAAWIEPKQIYPVEEWRFSNQYLYRLLTPVIAEQFLTVLVGITDTMMISYAGEAAVSSVSLVDQWNVLFIMIFTAVANGGAVVISQYIGSRNVQGGSLAAGQLVMMCLLSSLGLAAFLLAQGDTLFTMLFGAVEQDVRSMGLQYLRISAYALPFLALQGACGGILRSVGRTKEPMQAAFWMNIANATGNGMAIFVLRAGVEGVAWSTLVARLIAAGLLLFYICRPQRGNSAEVISLKWSGIMSWHSDMVLRILRIAVPGGVESGLFQLSKVALSTIVALFGTVQIAANGVAQSFWSMSALFCVGMGPAFITVVGQCVGGNDHIGAEYYMEKLLRLTFLGAVFWNFVMLAVTPMLLLVYDLSEETAGLVLLLVFLHNIGNAVLCPVSLAFTNGLRAAGDVTYAMYASLFATVICRVALSVLFAIQMDMGVVGIALAMLCEWATKTVLIWGRYRSGKWMHHAVIG